ncbi:MAG: ferrous iron transport protein B [Candidatus Thorarchaeota archaeon]|nr:ferrous iron transport protein B [Candidatus Thorarchaeota archaeon]
MTEATIRVALVGNANVGKSVVFNALTGLHQHVSNWPGKTIERAEGTLHYRGRTIDIIDLPGTYSLTQYSGEESVTREYIESKEADVLVNVIDAGAMERNLYLTLQLLEMRPKMVVALNQVDMAESRGIRASPGRLSTAIGVPVVATVATSEIGLTTLMDEVIRRSGTDANAPTVIKYSTGIETRICELESALSGLELDHPLRYVAIRLLEEDQKTSAKLYAMRPTLRTTVDRLRKEIEERYTQDATTVLASERYAIAARVASMATEPCTPKRSLLQHFDRVALNPILGYLLMLVLLGGMFYGVFQLGHILSGLIDDGFSALRSSYDAAFPGELSAFIWSALIEGVVAGVTVALPYILPMYIALSLLEDTGYLARIAFLMDSVMHKIGFHGKGFIPLIVGFGCNVPACMGCRVLETQRERLICGFAASLVPCTARSIVILGLVAAYVGFHWAVILYVLDFIILFVLTRGAFRLLPGEPKGLIMDMPCYRRPSPSTVGKKAWTNIREFVYVAFPIIIAGNLLLQLSSAVGLLDVVGLYMSPVIVFWLGLPTVAGIVLLFGVLRKELTLIMLAALLGTTNFALVLTPGQMIVFAFVVMLYVPCLATIATLVKEFGYRRAAQITVVEVITAVVLGGVLLRLLPLIGIY